MASLLNSYQNADGTPVANGFLLVGLNQTATALGNVISTNKVKVLLDANGDVVGSPDFFPTSSLNPPGTQYFLSIYTATGQLVSGPTILVI
jgi:hypothetical protein